MTDTHTVIDLAVLGNHFSNGRKYSRCVIQPTTTLLRHSTFTVTRQTNILHRLQKTGAIYHHFLLSVTM